MKDVFTLIMSYIPTYVPNLARVFSVPRTFLSAPEAPIAERLRESFIFFGLSIALSEFVTFPIRMNPAQTFVDHLIRVIVEAGVQLLFIATVSTAAWRVAGGHIAFEQSLFIANYTVGASKLLGSILLAAEFGLLRFAVPDFLAIWRSLPKAENPYSLLATLSAAILTGASSHPLAVFVGSLLTLALFALPVWIVLTLARTFRALDPLSMPRSIVAVCVAILVTAAAAPFMFFISIAV